MGTSGIGRVTLAIAMTCTFGFGALGEALAADVAQSASIAAQTSALQESAGASVAAALEDQPSVEEMLEEGEYAKHQAIAMVQTDAADSQSNARSNHLLGNAEVLATVSAESVGKTGGDIQIVAVKDKELSVKKMLTSLDADSRVLSVQPNYEVTLDDEDTTGGQGEPSDTDSGSGSDASYGDYTSLQWAYNNSISGVNPQSWNDGLQRYEDDVVAVIDSGIDYTNPDLADAMFDMTPYLDQIENHDSGQYGYNGIEDSPDPMDDHNHGTHCAGIIASSDNGYGTTGLAAGAKLIGAKALASNGGGYSASFIRCFGYLIEAAKALDGKLKSINCSWGGNGMSNTYGPLINELGSLGVVTVFASGNDSEDISKTAGSTAVFWGNPYVVAVNSSTIDNKPSSFSNNSALTDVYAPGSEILSTYPMDNQSYIPSLVDDNDAYHPFDSEGDSLTLYSSYEETEGASAKLSDEVATTYDSTQDAFNHEDSGSLSVKMSNLSTPQDEESKSLLGFDYGRGFYTALELGSSDIPCYFQGYFRVDSDKETVGKVYLGVQVRNKQGKWSATQWHRTRGSSPSGGDFGQVVLGTDYVAQMAVDSLCESDPAHYSQNARTRFVTTTDGDLVLRCFSCGDDEASFNDEHSVWIDDFAIGNSTVPYSFSSGTSMAAPLVAASCVVIDDELRGNAGYTYDSLGAADRACYLAAAIKASATNTGDGVYSNCLTEGRIDLAQLPHENAIKKWLDTKQIQDLIKEHTRLSSKEVFEDASLDAGLQEIIDPSAYPFGLDAVNGVLYLAVGNDVTEGPDQALHLFACDLKTGEWKTCSSPDLNITTLNSAAYQGKLIYSYSQQTSAGKLEHGIIQYNPKSDSWSDISAVAYSGSNAITGALSLVNCSGTLLAIGASNEDSSSSELAVYSCDLNNSKLTKIGVIDGAAYETDSSYAGEIECSASGSTVYLANVKHSSTDYEKKSYICFDLNGTELGKQKILDGPIDRAGEKSAEFGQYGSTIATADGLMMVGCYLCDESDELIDADTYTLAKGAEKAEPFARRLSDWYALNIFNCAYDGKLYTVGMSYIESQLAGGTGSSVFIRSTAVNTDAAPGDTEDDPVDPTPTPKPTPSPSSTWAAIGKTAIGKTYTAGSGKSKARYKVVKSAQARTLSSGKTEKRAGTVIYVASKVGKKAKSAVIPATVKIKGGTYKVVKVAAKAFAKKKRVRTVTVKASTLTKKKRVKASLKGSNVTKVKVRVSKKPAAKKVRKAFAKRSWVGKSVRIK